MRISDSKFQAVTVRVKTFLALWIGISIEEGEDKQRRNTSTLVMSRVIAH